MRQRIKGSGVEWLKPINKIKFSMKRVSLIIPLTLFFTIAFSQNLTREETIGYINNVFEELSGFSHIRFDEFDKKEKYELVEKIKLQFDNKTKKYLLQKDYTQTINGSRYKIIAKWNFINFSKIKDISYYENSATSNSDLSCFYLKFTESSIKLSIENSVLPTPYNSTTDNIEIKILKKSSSKDRLINAFKHLGELDKKEEQKDPFYN